MCEERCVGQRPPWIISARMRPSFRQRGSRRGGGASAGKGVAGVAGWGAAGAVRAASAVRGAGRGRPSLSCRRRCAPGCAAGATRRRRHRIGDLRRRVRGDRSPACRPWLASPLGVGGAARRFAAPSSVPAGARARAGRQAGAPSRRGPAWCAATTTLASRRPVRLSISCVSRASHESSRLWHVLTRHPRARG